MCVLLSIIGLAVVYTYVSAKVRVRRKQAMLRRAWDDRAKFLARDLKFLCAELGLYDQGGGMDFGREVSPGALATRELKRGFRAGLVWTYCQCD